MREYKHNMEISKLSLSNFRAFKKATFILNNLTVISGANASGKSTILEAIKK